MNRIVLISLVLSAVLLISPNGKEAHAQTLALVGQFDSGTGEGTEVISVQTATARAALTNSATGTISILDISNPAAPTLDGIFDLGLASGEGITSVAFHPTDNYFIVAVETEGANTGRVELRSAGNGRVINVLATGSEPDAVAIDRQGRRAVVSDEGESFSFNAATREFDSPVGSVTVIDLRGGARTATATLIPLPDATGTPGMVAAADRRFLERGVDINGDGEVADEFDNGEGGFDYNGNGVIEDLDFLAGFIDGAEVWGNENAGELVMIPLLDGSPKYLEPEIGAFSADGQFAYVAMQENNGVAVIDAVDNSFVGYIGLGTTVHDADIKDNGEIVFVENALFALREPDGIAVTPDGQYLVTADEGDTDPKASETDEGFPTAGGRTVSVFDAATGVLLGDTGNQLDLATEAIGQYPDGRSDSKGSEPENLATFMYRGVAYAAVGLERADSAALVSLADPTNPVVVSVKAVNPGSDDVGGEAPEGVAVYKTPEGSHFVYMANEGSGIVSVFEVVAF